MEHSGNIPIFNIPRTLFWEYSPEFHRELFPNTPGIYHGNVPRKFHEHIFARWVMTINSLSRVIVFWINVEEFPNSSRIFRQLESF